MILKCCHSLSHLICILEEVREELHWREQLGSNVSGAACWVWPQVLFFSDEVVQILLLFWKVPCHQQPHAQFQGHHSHAVSGVVEEVALPHSLPVHSLLWLKLAQVNF